MSGQRYWFMARGNGWGWSLPLTWQGWLVYALAAALLALGFVLFPPASRPAAFLGFHFAVLALLVLVCWKKGEPPSWR